MRKSKKLKSKKPLNIKDYKQRFDGPVAVSDLPPTDAERHIKDVRATAYAEGVKAQKQQSRQFFVEMTRAHQAAYQGMVNTLETMQQAICHDVI